MPTQYTIYLYLNVYSQVCALKRARKRDQYVGFFSHIDLFVHSHDSLDGLYTRVISKPEKFTPKDEGKL